MKIAPIKIAVVALATVAILCAACKGEYKGPMLNWTAQEVGGLQISLIDSTKVETYWFSPEGYATATFGTKGGPVTAPIVNWKITNGKLEIYDDKGQFDELILISRDKAIIHAVSNHNGQDAQYEIISSATN